MGCVSPKPNNAPLQKKEDDRVEVIREEVHPIKPEESPIPIQPQQKKEQRDPSLVLSGNPQWDQAQFIPVPQHIKVIQNSPIQILYSDPEQTKEHQLAIKRELFKAGQAQNSVIQQVSQEYIDSRMQSQKSGLKDFPSKNLKSQKSQDKIFKESQFLQPIEQIGEEQIMKFFEFNLPKLQIYSRPIAA